MPDLWITKLKGKKIRPEPGSKTDLIIAFIIMAILFILTLIIQ